MLDKIMQLLTGLRYQTPARGPKQRKHKAPGTKLARRAAAGKLGMRHSGGIVSEAFRNIAKERNYRG